MWTAAQGIEQLGRAFGSYSHASHTGIHLGMNPGNGSQAVGGLLDGSDRVYRGDGHGEVEVQEVGNLGGVLAAHHEDRAHDPGLPEHRSFLQERHRQPGRPQLSNNRATPTRPWP